MRTPLQKGEKILLVTHSSWTSLIGPVLLALAGVTASYFIGFLNHYGWIAAAAGSLIFLIRYYNWKVNIWVVTNYRVIDEAGLLSHYAKESPLDKINNVSYDQNVLGHLFNFGHVEIQTAAETGATDYYNVNHPKKLKETITAAQADYKNWQVTNQAQQMAAAIGAQNRAASSANAPNVAMELEKLFELKMKGALSEEEYNRAKARLLDHH
ncbi:MAG TPA: PH domain-containing protein [Puia sp.]|nr:PH domain-containing protein [Puia sp.]